MTGFDWQAYNEGCRKVIEALKKQDWHKSESKVAHMAEISYPVDANGSEIASDEEEWVVGMLTGCKRDL